MTDRIDRYTHAAEGVLDGLIRLRRPDSRSDRLDDLVVAASAVLAGVRQVPRPPRPVWRGGNMLIELDDLLSTDLDGFEFTSVQRYTAGQKVRSIADYVWNLEEYADELALGAVGRFRRAVRVHWQSHRGGGS